MDEIRRSKVPFELRAAPIMLYKLNSKFKKNKAYSEEINCNIGVKDGLAQLEYAFVLS